MFYINFISSFLETYKGLLNLGLLPSFVVPVNFTSLPTGISYLLILLSKDIGVPDNVLLLLDNIKLGVF